MPDAELNWERRGHLREGNVIRVSARGIRSR
jgi:hypothetical protein